MPDGGGPPCDGKEYDNAINIATNRLDNNDIRGLAIARSPGEALPVPRVRGLDRQCLMFYWLQVQTIS